ncbi:hypothetical protein DR64_7951 [Paraburkholderia xenovorans LB400]|nr:hypothetical protein [Paraburkholderia xenovorans]AIP34227.1 hypothetical protein DR64_7951 [Paraburkholderia xenovorans LB400]
MLKESSETKVVADIRSEHLFPVTDGDTARDSAGGWVQGRIELVEPPGSLVMVQVMVGYSVIVAQFERPPGFDVGRAIILQHKIYAPHAFDVGTERSVLAAPLRVPCGVWQCMSERFEPYS